VRLTTEAALAELLELPLDRVVAMRKRNQWPHLKFGRWDVRYTDAHIAEIVATHEVKRTRPAPRSGLTDRSARSLP